MAKKFDNTIEKDSAPPILKGKQIYDQFKHLRVVHGKGFKPKGRLRCKGREKEKEGKEKETVIDDQPKKNCLEEEIDILGLALLGEAQCSSLHQCDAR